MGAYAALISKLQEDRAALVGEMKEALATAAKETRGLTKDEQAAWDAKDGEVRDLDASVERYKAQEDREERAAAARAATGDTGPADGSAGGTTRAQVREPGAYDRESPHSYFRDLVAMEVSKGQDRTAGERLNRHAKDLQAELPRRREARKQAAEKAYSEAFLRTPAERRALEAMMRTGTDPFERRFISRTDGQGGYMVPPLWLIDEYVPYLRAGRPTANLFRNMPLPAGTDSINIPRIVLGTATGPQPGDGAPVPGRDLQDNSVNARIATIAGQQDAAMQLLDQSPAAFDTIIFQDLAADYAMQLNGQLLLGNGFPQLNGLYPAGSGVNVASTGSAAAAGGFSVQNTATAFSSATPPTLYTSVGQLVSLISRVRFTPPDHLVMNPAVWYALSTASDTQGRPLVVPSQQGNSFNQIAGTTDSPVAQGPVGHMLGIPIILDPNVPLTFGGSGATQPSMGAISNGNVAPLAGSGGTSGNANQFTPVIAAVFNDLFLWEGEIRTRTLSEVLSGTLQVRFQLYTYVADMVNRYQNSSNFPISYGQYNTIGTQLTVLSQGTGGLLVGF
jgi:HK97 family phage major capsid protein